MPFNERSKHVTQGVARSPNGAKYYALGYEKADFDKPMTSATRSPIPKPAVLSAAQPSIFNDPSDRLCSTQAASLAHSYAGRSSS